MKLWKKVLIGVGGVALVVAIVVGSIKATDKGEIPVQIGKVVKEDLTSVVTATGDIKPKYYVNISPSLMGRIIKINVKEGDTVKNGDLLLQMESTQQSADVKATQAALQSSMADSQSFDASVKSAEANYKTAQATLVKAQADFDRAKLDYDRSQGLKRDGLISQQTFDSAKATFEVSRASLEESRARLASSRSQLDQANAQKISAFNRVDQSKATLMRSTDMLGKTTFRASLSGIITNLPVHEGENVVPGIQNTAGSLLMTIADMSIITAEVRVDETDIVNLALNQPVEISVDAMPNQALKGRVTEIGNSALTKSGLTATQASNSQEAKDFKVVVTIDDPPPGLRPGLSCTSRITTAKRSNVLAVPIQAITIRDLNDIREQEKRSRSKGKSQEVTRAATPPSGGSAAAKKKNEVPGVFVVTKDNRAVFRPVETGISGQSDIEITKGLEEGDRIVTGNYKTLRTIKTETFVKEEKKLEKKSEASGS